ncbi:MAG: substrate-binding domain-containing protein [Chloroflexi bacterium]|nr:substrate-binding domain-containing protein [Chloroflexota bacterium]
MKIDHFIKNQGSHRSEYRFARLALVIAALLLAAACSGAAPTPTPTPEPTVPPQAAEPEYTFGLAISEPNAFFITLQEGAQEAADRLSVGLVVEEAGNDAETQATQIQSLIDQGVDALLINPVDADAVVASIEAANTAGIPVFTVDRSANGGEVVAHIASDNFAGGRMAGNYLAEAIGEEGSVVELKGRENTSAAQQRGAGFNEAIGAFENIEIIAAETANFDRTEGQTVFAAILEANADIDGVFAHNDEMILGAVEAAREADRLADIRFVGFDAIEDALTALEAGDLLATIAQQPAEMGRLGVETALKLLQGETVNADIPVDLALITR